MTFQEAHAAEEAALHAYHVAVEIEQRLYDTWQQAKREMHQKLADYLAAGATQQAAFAREYPAVAPPTYGVVAEVFHVSLPQP